MAFMHRFSSRSWWDHVSKHFSADLSSAFDEIVRLKVRPIQGWSLQRLDHKCKSFLDRSSDRVGAVSSGNAAKVGPASFRAHVVSAWPSVSVG